MDFVTVSTGLILPYWMGLPIRYIQLISNSITILFQLQIIKNENLRKSLEISELNNEMMISKFNSLNKEYESNFKFLHNLLHTCAELNQLIDHKMIMSR